MLRNTFFFATLFQMSSFIVLMPSERIYKCRSFLKASMKISIKYKCRHRRRWSVWNCTRSLRAFIQNAMGLWKTNMETHFRPISNAAIKCGNHQWCSVLGGVLHRSEPPEPRVSETLSHWSTPAGSTATTEEVIWSRLVWPDGNYESDDSQEWGSRKGR